ncbi:MAG: MoaD/ThiS family protein [Candidatus Bathyarchaeota archaeon]|nr:MoaD/ThiS family protein [Candidatus Bathyarchaeota archaeon]MDH5733562.1 MoaD/ThiS family protein [Candidatus Bathyarchaeota archaeon]
MIHVKVRFLGVFREFCGRSRVTVELEDTVTVRNFIQKLAETFSSKFKETLIDPELSDPRPNALILVNGKEIGVLQGLQTLLCNCDEMVLLPVAHGG